MAGFPARRPVKFSPPASKKRPGARLWCGRACGEAMKTDSGLGDHRTDSASERPALAAPLPFPNADGPERPREAPESGAAPGPAAGQSGPWPLTPALIGAPCGVAVLSIALRDGLGLRADWTAAVTLVAGALIGLLLARRLTRPIQALSVQAERLTVRYTGRSASRGRNEMQNLVASFESMYAAFLAQFERLKSLQLDELQNSLELQRRYALMRLLRELSTAAYECESLEQVLERALDELGGYLDWPIGRVLLVDAAAQRGVAARRSIWFAGEQTRFASFVAAIEAAQADPSEHDLIGRASATGMPHWVTDLGRLAGWPQQDVAMRSGLKSGFVIPIAADGTVRAFIEFFSDHRVEASAEMIELIEAIQTELWRAGERNGERQRHAQPAARREPADRLGESNACGAAIP